ncbi:AAA family ATPase [Actinomadura sp. ATCC 31491]|uniref:AAA family ATPase n=1 Tax=Actinomadura luzonensis TaxID=2805427 RepID=A0ABT0G3Q6_9ACTN|nr:AAA family ATPase [Actinomadura luzonensis]MCK2219033.1 AAA family ATPase [Actinomadura luzonensis]
MLIIIRGNSGSGKSSVARAAREAYGRRGLAVVPQDVVRRDLLREEDRPGAVNIGLLDVMCRHVLDAGHHVILEGILAASRYGDMLGALCRDHRGATRCYYLDVSWEETVRRHATRPQRTAFTPDDMRPWYRRRDLLPGGLETVVPEASTLAETVRLVLGETGLLPAAGGRQEAADHEAGDAAAGAR